MSPLKKQIFAILAAAILFGIGILVPVSQSENRIAILVAAIAVALVTIGLIAFCIIRDRKKKK